MNNETKYILETQAQWWTPQGVKNMIGRLTGTWSISLSGKAQFTQLGEDWISLPLTDNGIDKWEWFGAPQSVPQYRRAGDCIEIKGLVKRTLGVNPVIAIMPVGYRPTREEVFACVSNTGFADVRIATNGDLYLSSGGTAGLSLQLRYTLL